MGWFRHKQDPPYLADLADFSGHVDRLEDGDLLFLGSAQDESSRAERDSVRLEAEACVTANERQKVAADLDDGLVRWAGAMSRPTGYTSLLGATAIHLEPDLRREALPAIRDAGWAILLRDVLSPTAYDALIEPWRALSDAPGTGGGTLDDPDPDAEGSAR